MDGEIKPFIIINNDGRIVETVQTNTKGYRKSIENNAIWAVNTETGRLLPRDAIYNIESFSEKEGWYEAHVKNSEDSTEVRPEKGANDRQSSTESSSAVIESLFAVIEARRKELPEGSYTTHLFNSGISKIKKKTGEEAIELLLAETREETIFEAADLIYHMLVLLSASEIEPREIFAELKNRE